MTPPTTLPTFRLCCRSVAIAVLLASPAVGSAQAPAGTYELTAHLGGQSFPVRLELTVIGERPWGRLVIRAGRDITGAVQGVARTGETWRFAVGGPMRSLELAFADSVEGTLELGGRPPIRLAGRLTDVEIPNALRAHHALTPLDLGAAADTGGVSFPTGTPDGDLVFALHGPDLTHQTLATARPAGDGWSDPDVLPISGRHSDRSPAVLPDGSALLFASDRPADAGADATGYGLWIASASGRGSWARPMPVRFEGGWPHDARQPSITADGTLYFSSSAEGGYGEGDIYVAERVAPGQWSTPRNLGPAINGPADEHGSYVAPDGSWMILVSAGAGNGREGGDDLFLSVRTANGWSAPAPLPLPVNTFANEYGPWVSPADGYLYFTSDRYGLARIFRIDARTAGLPAAARN